MNIKDRIIGGHLRVHLPQREKRMILKNWPIQKKESEGKEENTKWDSRSKSGISVPTRKSTWKWAIKYRNYYHIQNIKYIYEEKKSWKRRAITICR